MQDQQKLFVEAIKNAKNVLVTVGVDPSVDQLAATIGLALALNKLEKHATAVFSGQIPSALEFLKPEETLEKTTDSLRDFIIALDKNKADRLRYKVEDDVVRIFITPFHTAISDKDLDFSQGDFNVDLVVALGVESLEDIDAAVKEHGRILHDAVVVALSTSAVEDMGTVTWTAERASSLCEMVLVALQEVDAKLVDQQIATALLTGIVASTDRFSNDRTTPVTMNASASLMAAGANQQLITSQLEAPETAVEPVAEQTLPEPAAPPSDLLGFISHDDEPVVPEEPAIPELTPAVEPEVPAQEEPELQEQVEPTLNEPVNEEAPEPAPTEDMSSESGISLHDDEPAEDVNSTEIRVDDDGRLRRASEAAAAAAENAASSSEQSLAVHRQLLTGHDQLGGLSSGTDQLADPSLEPTVPENHESTMLSHSVDAPAEVSTVAPTIEPSEDLQDKYEAALNATLPADGVPKPPPAAVEVADAPVLPPVQPSDDLSSIGLPPVESNAPTEGMMPPPPVPPPLIPPQS